MKRTATAAWTGGLKDGKGQITTQSGVLSDTRYGFTTRFENEPGTNPEELIAAAHASCFTMATSFALAGAGHTEGELETDCAITLEPDGPGFKITRSALKLRAKVPGITDDDFARIADEAKANCPISKLLNCENPASGLKRVTGAELAMIWPIESTRSTRSAAPETEAWVRAASTIDSPNFTFTTPTFVLRSRTTCAGAGRSRSGPWQSLPTSA